MHKFGIFLQVLLLCNAQHFTAEAKLLPNQCLKRKLINEENDLEIFYICPNEKSMNHLCDKSFEPFETWYHKVTMFKTSSIQSNDTTIWKNKTVLGNCDSTWQDPLRVKYRYCNETKTYRTSRDDPNGLIQPPQFQVVIWIMAVLAVVGNLIVFVSSFLLIKRKFSSMSEVTKVHHIMLVNLALADFLMGAYLLGIAITAAVLSGSMGRFLMITTLSPLCNFFGVVSLVSSQMSVTVLVLMTSFRLNSVLRPFHVFNAKTSIVGVACCWIVWIMFACIPVLDTNYTVQMFETIAVRSCETVPGANVFSYKNIRQILDEFLENISNNCSSSSNHSLFLSNSVQGPQALTIAQHLELVDDKHFSISYYNQEPLCTPTYFFEAVNDSKIYGMSILVFNFVSFFYMLIAYGLIWSRTSGSKSCVSCCNESNNGNVIGEREKEDQRLFRKVILIIVTDFLCWMPTCILAFFYMAFVYDPQIPELCDRMHSLWFPKAIFTTIVLPINSALNPILYSAAPIALFNRVFRRRSSSTRNRGSKTRNNRKPNTAITDIPLADV